jgi:hypothetical protein
VDDCEDALEYLRIRRAVVAELGEAKFGERVEDLILPELLRELVIDRCNCSEAALAAL